MKWIEEEITFFEFAQKFLGINDMSTPQNIDIESLGIEIESMMSDGSIGYAPMTSFIVKESVDSHWRLGNLKGSSVHRVLYKGEYIELNRHPDAMHVNEPICIVDTSVESTQNYLANGQINHNTTSGGMAIPFHASVRIKLGAGQQIADKNKEVIGINVSAKTVKNKVSAPFRTCNFEIHFGVGIKEHEQLFDILRKHGPEVVNGMRLEVGGTGAWKTFTVLREDTGEVIVDRKFYKAEFDKLLDDPELSEFLSDLLDAAMTKKRDTEAPDIDAESYEEVRSIAMGLDEGTLSISPED